MARAFAALSVVCALGCTSVSLQGPWKLTVYVTAVEKFHAGARETVQGCRGLACKHGQDYLGHYPATFIKAVKDQGTGRITTGTFAGKYLNWSIDTGYWLDDTPRDAHGGTLEPWISAAADPTVAAGTRVTIAECGVDVDNGQPIDARVCEQIKNARWVVRDRFTVGKVGRWLDLYIGEQHGPNHEKSAFTISTKDAKVVLAPP